MAKDENSVIDHILTLEGRVKYPYTLAEAVIMEGDITLDKKLETIEQSVDSATKKAESARKGVETVSADLLSVEEHVESHDESIGTITEDILSIHQHMDEQQEEIGGLVGAISGINDSIGHINNDINTINGKIEKQGTDILAWTTIFEDTQKTIVRVGNDLADAKDDIKDNTTSIENLAVTVLANQEYIQRVDEDCRQLTQVINGKQEQLTATQLEAVDSGITSDLVADITQTKNDLLDLGFGDVAGGKNLVYKTLKQTTISTSGNTQYAVNYDTHIAKVSPNTTYTAKSNEDGVFVYAEYTSEPNGQNGIGNTRYVISGSNVQTFTTSSTTQYIAFRSDINFAFAQLELGSSATSYEPYIMSNKVLTDGVGTMSLPITNYNNRATNLINDSKRGNSKARIKVKFTTSLDCPSNSFNAYFDNIPVPKISTGETIKLATKSNGNVSDDYYLEIYYSSATNRWMMRMMNTGSNKNVGDIIEAEGEYEVTTVDEIKDSLLDIPTTKLYNGNSKCQYAKIGNLVIVNLWFYETTANSVIFTLPAGYRPSSNCEFWNFFHGNSSTFNSVQTIIGTNGTIKNSNPCYRGGLTAFFTV